ncbi:MAG: hypothetical protein ACP5UH_02595 [Candidatus Micrarchaeia archaeon]
MDYKDMLGMAEDIEEASAKSAVGFVDISKVEAAPSSGVTYDELLNKITRIYSGRVREERPPKEAQRPAHIITAGLAQAAYSQPQVPARQVPPAVQAPFQNAAKPQQAPRAQSSEEEAKKAKLELGAVIKKLGSAAKIPAFRTRQVNISELVLPNLALTDQIAELERIIEGLKENVFDKEHMAIVQEELYGLNQVVNSSKRQGKQVPKSELEGSLFELRDQRLAEALVLLGRVA